MLRDVRWLSNPMIEFEQRISVDRIYICIYFIVIRTMNQKSVDQIAKENIQTKDFKTLLIEYPL